MSATRLLALAPASVQSKAEALKPLLELFFSNLGQGKEPLELAESQLPEELISALAGALAIGAGQGRAAGGEAANRAAEGRHQLDPGVVKKAVKRAVGGAGVCEEASWHSFRHC
jgi:hypothetical protein